MANATPIETARPARPADAASATDSVLATIVEVSSAVIEMLAAEMPCGSPAALNAVGLSLSTKALTVLRTRFCVLAPAPAAPMPTAPIEMAAAADSTWAVIVWVPSAVMLSAPSASSVESLMYASTSLAFALPSVLKPIRFSAVATPMARPTAATPAPSETATPPTVALMVDVSSAVTTTAPPLSITLSSM